MEITPCADGDWKAILEGLNAYNRERLPDVREVPYEFPQFKVVIDGKMAGGILGRLEGYGTLYIEVLYVEPEYRGQRLGTKLIERMVAWAKEHGCPLIFLSTYDFQARGFYEKCGFSVFGELVNCPPGHTKFFLKRDLP